MGFLAVHNVCKCYQGHNVLDGVSIAVPKGSVFGLLGPNGAGKTTLMRIINRIIFPDKGELLFNGRKMIAGDVAVIGYLPEERGLYRKMKVGEQALYFARLKGLKRSEAEKELRQWFEKFGIQNWWYRKTEELSKGMQQKVQFIVTVAHKPALLVLDEPFSGFDPINAGLIRDEIINLSKQGITVLFSTHNMNSVEEICDHIALIDKSKKILEGKVSDIRRQYRTNIYEIAFAGNMIGFANAIGPTGEIQENVTEDGVHKVKIKLMYGFKTSDLLKNAAVVAEIISFRELLPSMNEIFINKVNELA